MTATIEFPSALEILLTREFEAPINLVFDVMTQPEHVRHHFAPFGEEVTVCEIDLRVGGKYRYVWQADRDGEKMGSGGVYLEIVAPERLVATEKFDDAWYPGEAVVTHTFEDKGDWTLLSLRIRYESAAARDGVIRSPMESGVAAGYDQLEEMLAAGAGLSAP